MKVMILPSFVILDHGGIGINHGSDENICKFESLALFFGTIFNALSKPSL